MAVHPLPNAKANIVKQKLTITKICEIRSLNIVKVWFSDGLLKDVNKNVRVQFHQSSDEAIEDAEQFEARNQQLRGNPGQVDYRYSNSNNTFRPRTLQQRFNNPIPIERMLGNIAGMTMTHNFPLFASTLCQIDTQQQVGRTVNQRKTSPVLNTETISLSPTQSAQTVTCSKIPPTNENLQHMSLPSPLMTVSQPHQPTNSSSKPSVTTQDITTHTNTSPPPPVAIFY